MSQKLFEAERRFMELIWEEAPVNSTRLCALALERLGWKKSTTYTMLRRLTERGFLQNESATVAALVSREAFLQMESEELIESGFSGSVPAFLASYLRGRRLSGAELDELKRMIDEVGP
ncbi:MAG: BlaI/MecI/CopY family transcriptional regulator [Clostridiaceae bacterium]|nr:BlaI/MecI/CopY family transcriptional regulator [Eubacteriales bacterium]